MQLNYWEPLSPEHVLCARSLMHLQPYKFAGMLLIRDECSLLLREAIFTPPSILVPVNLLLGPLSDDSLGGMLLFFYWYSHFSCRTYIQCIPGHLSQVIYQIGHKSTCSWTWFWHRENKVPLKNLLSHHENTCLWKRKVRLNLKSPSWTCWIGAVQG